MDSVLMILPYFVLLNTDIIHPVDFRDDASVWFSGVSFISKFNVMEIYMRQKKTYSGIITKVFKPILCIPTHLCYRQYNVFNKHNSLRFGLFNSN